MVWPAWPPGGHSGKRPGGLWLAIWGACGGRQGGSEGVALELSQDARVSYLEPWEPGVPSLGRPVLHGQPTQAKRPYLATADPSPAWPSALGGPPSSSTQPLP